MLLQMLLSGIICLSMDFKAKNDLNYYMSSDFTICKNERETIALHVGVVVKC